MNIQESHGLDIVHVRDRSTLPSGEGWTVLGSCAVRRRGRNRFDRDSITFVKDGRLFSIAGVILNSPELIKRNAASSLEDALFREFEGHGWSFPAGLRGNFSGIIYDEASDELLAFTNHLGARPLFHYGAPNGDILVSSDLMGLSRLMKERAIPRRIDETAARFILTFGFMLDERTLLEGVSRLPPGSVLAVGRDHRELRRYWSYSNEPREIGEGEAADSFYELFSQAIKRGFDKDEDYGFGHLALLSGGLDSRMISYFAHRLGYRDLLTVTFGQAGCEDERTAAAISAELGYDHLFMPLGAGDYLLDVEEPVRRNGGIVLYGGSAHAVRAYRRLDWNRYGLLHNGDLADVSQGDYVEGLRHTRPSPKTWAYSTRLFGAIEAEATSIARGYPNQEAFAIHTRGINGILNGSISALADTETDEPFLDADLVDFAMHLPLRLKYRERLFVRMIEDRFPDAARHPWQKWGLRPTMHNHRLTGTYSYRAMRKGLMIGGPLLRGGAPSRSDMNPIGYWEAINPGLSAGLDTIFDDLIASTSLSGQLLEDIEGLYRKGNLLERTQPLTVLMAAKLLDIGASQPGR
jgi:asparagine synthase (glutamine-hydrolysing)